MSTPDPIGNLGQQLLVKLEQDGSGPALDLLAKLTAANGSPKAIILAVEESLASDAGLPLVILQDESAVLVQWLFYRLNHWATNHGFGLPVLPDAIPAPPAAPQGGTTSAAPITVAVSVPEASHATQSASPGAV